MTSSDFFSYSYLKGIAYKNNPYSLEQFDVTMNKIYKFTRIFQLFKSLLLLYNSQRYFYNCIRYTRQTTKHGPNRYMVVTLETKI